MCSFDVNKCDPGIIWTRNFKKFKGHTGSNFITLFLGNPGLPGFYTTFGSSLYESLNKEIPVWVIGHAGHDEPPPHEHMKVPKLKNNTHLYTLEGQIKHKIEFIDLIPEQINKIYVIGHSVGARIILDLLKLSKKFDQKVEKCYLMFPTIEYIADSAHGKIFTKLISLFFVVKLFLVFFNIFPLGFRKRVVKLYCRDMPEEFHEHCLQHTKTDVVEKIVYMANDEMQKINEYDEELIRNNLHRLKLYYGRKDGWVRKRFYYGIVEKFPEIDAELCTRSYEHAFVLKNGVECGAMIAEWIIEHSGSSSNEE